MILSVLSRTSEVGAINVHELSIDTPALKQYVGGLRDKVYYPAFRKFQIGYLVFLNNEKSFQN